MFITNYTAAKAMRYIINYIIRESCQQAAFYSTDRFYIPLQLIQINGRKIKVINNNHIAVTPKNNYCN